MWVAYKQSESGKRKGTETEVGAENSRGIGMSQARGKNATYRGSVPASRYRSSVCPTIRLRHGPLKTRMA